MYTKDIDSLEFRHSYRQGETIQYTDVRWLHSNIS